MTCCTILQLLLRLNPKQQVGPNLLNILQFIVRLLSIVRSIYDSDLQHAKISLSVNCLPSVLWRCWLGGRKGIRHVKNWVVGCWHGYLSGARCRLAYGLADASATHCLLLQKIQLVLLFWYRLTWVVPEKGPLNGRVCVYGYGYS